MLKNKTFRSLFPIALMTGVILSVIAATWIITDHFLSMAERLTMSSNETVLPKADCDEVWMTKQRLCEMEMDIMRYYEISDEPQWEAIRNVRTLEELWELLHQRFDIVGPLVPSPPPRRYLRDAWDHPYLFDIKAQDEDTVLRITSRDQGQDLYVEITFVRSKRGCRAKCSWGGGFETVP
jgi:hypothetical protein